MSAFGGKADIRGTLLNVCLTADARLTEGTAGRGWPSSAKKHDEEIIMMRVLILAATALDISAASASANGYRHHYGYGYATPVFEYEAGAYYGYPAPSYIHTPWLIYAAVPTIQRP